MNMQRLQDDLMDLSYVYLVALDEDFESIIVKDFNLPPGYNYDSIPILLELPRDYPESPPGICLLYTSPSPRDLSTSRMPSSA